MPSPSVLLPKEKELAKQVGFIVRLGLEWREPRTLQLAQELMLARFQRPVPFAEEGVLREDERSLHEVGEILNTDLLEGRIRVRLVPVDPLRELEQGPPYKLDPLPPRKAEDKTTFFEVRVVDEIGRAISDAPIELNCDGEIHELSTNAAGVATLENATASTATAAISETTSIEQILETRWRTPRSGRPPTEGNTTEILFDGAAIGPLPIKAAVPNTIVLKPALGILHLELWDKSGRVRHAKRDYSISGPSSFSGTTDGQGRLCHEDVVPGDHALTLTLDEDSYDVPLDVLEPGAPPQIRFVGAVPFVELARLKGAFFETNKSFLLPSVVERFKHVRELYANNNPSELLIVGHTDTTAQASVNDPLSLERANCTAAYLLDDVDAWLAMYESGTPAARRWGNREDLLMLEALPDFGTKAVSEDAIRWFQRTRGLSLDGIAGPETRGALIAEYMALDGATLSNDPNFDITITTHGCGENFPLDDAGEELDTAPADDDEDAQDRRVELFFFDAEFGIQPPPPGSNSAAGSSEYPEWRKKAVLVHDLESDHTEGLVLEWSADLDDDLPEDLIISASQDGTEQAIAWADGEDDAEYRRFVFDAIVGDSPVTLIASSSSLDLKLTLWDQQVASDPENPPTWTHWLEEMVGESEPDGSLDAGSDVPAVSDAKQLPDDLAGDMFT
jgi:outer membrane protein OmpA-like peptidoglycan-associated protein